MTNDWEVKDLRLASAVGIDWENLHKMFVMLVDGLGGLIC